DRSARHQVLALIEILQQGRTLGVLVVTHPTFKKVNVFATPRAAIGHDAISIQPKGALEIVGGDLLIGRCGRRRGKYGHSNGERNVFHMCLLTVINYSSRCICVVGQALGWPSASAGPSVPSPKYRN